MITNAALMKPAAESTTFLINILPGVAVDGNRDTDFFGNLCTFTARHDTTSWWRVDLQDIYGIITVRMLNRMGKYKHLIEIFSNYKQKPKNKTTFLLLILSFFLCI